MELNRADCMARKLIRQHLGSSWQFGWNRRKATFALCNFTDSRIELSQIHTRIESESSVRDSILHEIAHAIAGYDNHHNHVWQHHARELGITDPQPTAVSENPSLLPYTYAIMHGDELIRGYYRKPGKRTIADIEYLQVRGEPDTYGKLRLVKL